MRQYKLTPARRDKIRRYVKERRYKAGWCAKFIRMTKTTGVKLYTDMGLRDRAVTRQRLAYKHKLAPNVGRRFAITCNGIMYYGYFTEAANMAFSRKPAEYYNRHNLENDLETRLYQLGMPHDDMHCGNYGRLKGRWVCVDFDDVSVFGDVIT